MGESDDFALQATTDFQTLQHACIKAQVGKKTHENQGKLKKLIHTLCIGNYFLYLLKSNYF